MCSVRVLTTTEYEVWAVTVNQLVDVCPYFVKTLSLLRPAVDEEASTAYTDPYGRVALSPRFFTDLTQGRRAGWVLHEALHLINNHFMRSEAAGHQDMEVSNIAGDLEINQLIRSLAGSQRDTIGIELPEGVQPENYQVPAHRLMEEYYTTLNADGGKNMGEQQQGTDGMNKLGDIGNNTPSPQNDDAPMNGEPTSGNDSPPQTSEHNNNEKNPHGFCHPCDDTKTQNLDAANILRAEDIDITLAQQDTQTQVEEYLKTHPGNSALNNALHVTLDALQPAKTDWRSILRTIIGTVKTTHARGNRHRTYRRPSRRTDAISDSGILLPTTYGDEVSAMFAVDTSGSMGNKDFTVFATEVTEALKQLSKGRKKPVPMFAVDTVVKNEPMFVSDVADFDFTGGGGTDMAPAFTYIRTLEKQRKPGGGTQAPGLFVLATDGYVPWEKVMKELKEPHTYTPVILITHEGGYQQVPDSIKEHAHIIDCHQ